MTTMSKTGDDSENDLTRRNDKIEIKNNDKNYYIKNIEQTLEKQQISDNNTQTDENDIDMYHEESSINNLPSQTHFQNLYTSKNQISNKKDLRMMHKGLINNTDIDIHSGEDALQTEYIEDTQQ